MQRDKVACGSLLVICEFGALLTMKNNPKQNSSHLLNHDNLTITMLWINLLSQDAV